MSQSAIRLMQKMEINTPVKGVTGLVLDGAVGFGSSYLLGQAYIRYKDKWYGKQAPRIVAGIGKAGAILFSALDGGRQTFAGSLFNSVGQSGINAMGLELGLDHGRDAGGEKKKSAGVPALPGTTHVGALNPAAKGRAMSWDMINELAAGR
jgi:hypothetical protein